jgi:hypothetical protein
MPIPFAESLVALAWHRSGRRCECQMQGCLHYGRCSNILVWNHRGLETAFGWEAHHINPAGPATLSNCLILCQQCHKNTRTFGR